MNPVTTGTTFTPCQQASSYVYHTLLNHFALINQPCVSRLPTAHFPRSSACFHIGNTVPILDVFRLLGFMLRISGPVSMLSYDLRSSRPFPACPQTFLFPQNILCFLPVRTQNILCFLPVSTQNILCFLPDSESSDPWPFAGLCGLPDSAHLATVRLILRLDLTPRADSVCKSHLSLTAA